MVRLLCALTASMTLACTPTWESQVTYVRKSACTTTLGLRCVYAYQAETEEHEGRCEAQQLPPEARLVSCREHRERRGSSAAFVVGFLSPLVIVAVILGLAAMAPPI